MAMRLAPAALIGLKLPALPPHYAPSFKVSATNCITLAWNIALHSRAIERYGIGGADAGSFTNRRRSSTFATIGGCHLMQWNLLEKGRNTNVRLESKVAQYAP